MVMFVAGKIKGKVKMENTKFSWGLVIDTINVEGYTFKKYHPYKNDTFGRPEGPEDREKVLYHVYVDGKDTNVSTHTLEGAMLVAISRRTLGAHASGLDMLTRALKHSWGVLNIEKVVTYQPIELAPKDGSEVVCWCPCLGWRALYWDTEELKWTNASSTLNDYEPTHFVDLEDP